MQTQWAIKTLGGSRRPQTETVCLRDVSTAMMLKLDKGSLAKIIVYSMSVDGPIKAEPSGESTPMTTDGTNGSQGGYLAGCRALSSLEKLITSTETFFHPSNTGPWTMLVGALSV